ncbi:MAG TPA: hypothetical protein VGJ82_13040 [Thermoanaerobaculia bacterium]|jgi:hypothetical protein
MSNAFSDASWMSRKAMSGMSRSSSVAASSADPAWMMREQSGSVPMMRQRSSRASGSSSTTATT